MGLLERIERAESERAAAEFVGPVVLVVTRETPVGRTVVSREVLSPFTRRALRGELPTHKETPME